MTVEPPSQTEVVQAAGGLVVRRRNDSLEIAIVHRPVHPDWSFPKGKLEDGETFERRRCERWKRRPAWPPAGPLHRAHRVHRPEGPSQGGRHWVMAAQSGHFEPNVEVDELRWVPLEEASRWLSDPRDDELVAVLMAADQVEPLI